MLDRIGPGVFRYFLCIVVVLFHCTNLVAIGEWAVHVFFILSGYWVTRMYQEKYKDFKHPLTSFWASRLLRLLPVFYVTTILLILANCIVFHISVGEYLGQFKPGLGFLFSHIFILGLTKTGQLNPPTWSLDIEMQFYLLVPIFCWILVKLNRRIVWILPILFVIFSVVYMFHHQYYVFPPVGNYLCFFIVGVWLYQSKYHATAKQMDLTVALAFIAIGITYVVPILLEEVVLTNALRVGGILFRVYFDYALALLMIPFISRNIRNKSNESDKHFANLSYVTYLFHRVSMVPWAYHYSHLPLWERMPSFIIYLIVTFVGSLIIYYLIDIPFERLRKKIVD
jgi:peptidoglycan/LPS O-acetylase OafA/YrhL